MNTKKENSKQQKKYLLELTENQCWTLKSALDLYSRIGAGDIEEILLYVRPKNSAHVSELARNFMRLAHNVVTGFDGYGHWGITSPEILDTFRIAYDIEQVVRNRLAHDSIRPGDTKGMRVDFDVPVRTSTEESLPKIEEVK